MSSGLKSIQEEPRPGVPWLRPGLIFVLILMLWMTGASRPTAAAPESPGPADNTVKNILILNSYHKGYKWSDDIVKGIEHQLQGKQFHLHVEYMDTKRIETPDYLAHLAGIYRHKFADRRFDLIVSSDDAAFTFIKQHHESIFPDTPVVACGLNYFIPGKTASLPWLVAAVPEVFDIAATLDAALAVHPETTTVHVINDHTPTGRLIQKAFDKMRHRFAHRVQFILLDGADMNTIRNTLAAAPATSLALLLVYFRDNKGHYYDPKQAARLITEKAGRPVYGVWDFYMHHGIMGGMLTRGYGQGEVAGRAAFEILSGNGFPEEKIRRESANSLLFDYHQLKRFQVPLSAVPRNATILNMKYNDQKNILILNSYGPQLKWTRDIVKEMLSVLEEMPGRKKIFIEYMDTKNFPGPETYSHLLDIYRYKYTGTDFDVVLVSDDNAFKFALQNRKYLFKEAPLVFCGVNYLNEHDLKTHKGVTGILETTDIRGTLKLMHHLHPDARNILVINDQSATGRANRRRIMEEMPAAMVNAVHFEFTPPMKMTDLQARLQELPANTLVLLMTFNRDWNNNVFSYRESIDLITSHTRNPIYGVWDFYLGRGIVGGILTSGRQQGGNAARMALKILSGTPADAVPIVRKTDAVAMFDAEMVKRHGISPSLLPEGSHIINEPPPFHRQYQQRIRIAGFTLAVLGCILSYLLWRMYAQRHVRKVLEVQASIDNLTGVLNRPAGMNAVAGMMKRCDDVKMKMVVCYVDINRLKPVNDTLGHAEGDRYIRLVARTMKECVRERDVVARVGGDEFLLALYNHDLESAEKVVRRFQKVLAQKTNSEQWPYDVGVSAGMAIYNPSAPCSMEALIDRADETMYADKHRR